MVILVDDWKAVFSCVIIPKSLPHPPVLHDSEAPWCHAVDAPVRDPLVVADRDGEAAVVGAHHPDLVVGGAGKGQLAALAGVHRLHRHPAWARWRWKGLMRCNPVRWCWLVCLGLLVFMEIFTRVVGGRLGLAGIGPDLNNHGKPQGPIRLSP